MGEVMYTCRSTNQRTAARSNFRSPTFDSVFKVVRKIIEMENSDCKQSVDERGESKAACRSAKGTNMDIQNITCLPQRGNTKI